MARKIKGSVIARGRIFSAGDEDALAKVLSKPAATRLAAAGVIEGDWGAEIPSLSKLAEHIADMDREAVEALQASDDRKGAEPIYEARLAEFGE